MQTLEIIVSNVKCGGCVSNIQQGLRSIAGVQEIAVDIPQGRVTIQGDALDESVIRDKLAALGYPPVN